MRIEVGQDADGLWAYMITDETTGDLIASDDCYSARARCESEAREKAARLRLWAERIRTRQIRRG